MNILFSVFTQYQLIVAVNLKLKMFQNESADIIIHDHSNGYEKIAERLGKICVFKNIFLVRSHGPISAPTFSSKAARTINILMNRDDIIRKTFSIPATKYDLFLFYNYNYFNTSLYYKLKKKYPDILSKRFEEGYACLFDFECKGNISSSVALQKKLEKIHNNPKLDDIKEMYIFEPDLALFDKNHLALQMPKFNKNSQEIKRILNYVFDYKEDINFDSKYIFFEESYFADGRAIDDKELVLKIADLVGKDNLMVKLHPRNPVDRFVELGIKTIGQSGIPWEVVIMNHNFSDNVFLTIASGSVLSPRIIFDDNIPTFMLYNCTNISSPILKQGNFPVFMSKFKDKYGENGFYIPDNFEDFQNILRKRGL